jgi:hypothetical protein
MIDGNVATRVSLDMIWMYVNGLWTVIFTKHVMLCFTWLNCVFGGLSIFIAFYWIAGSCHPWLVGYNNGILVKKGLYHTLSCILFCTSLRVVEM